jgi:hypothetical protein
MDFDVSMAGTAATILEECEANFEAAKKKRRLQALTMSMAELRNETKLALIERIALIENCLAMQPQKSQQKQPSPRSTHPEHTALQTTATTTAAITDYGKAKSDSKSQHAAKAVVTAAHPYEGAGGAKPSKKASKGPQANQASFALASQLQQQGKNVRKLNWAWASSSSRVRDIFMASGPSSVNTLGQASIASTATTIHTSTPAASAATGSLKCGEGVLPPTAVGSRAGPMS